MTAASLVKVYWYGFLHLFTLVGLPQHFSLPNDELVEDALSLHRLVVTTLGAPLKVLLHHDLRLDYVDAHRVLEVTLPVGLLNLLKTPLELHHILVVEGHANLPLEHVDEFSEACLVLALLSHLLLGLLHWIPVTLAILVVEAGAHEGFEAFALDGRQFIRHFRQQLKLANAIVHLLPLLSGRWSRLLHLHLHFGFDSLPNELNVARRVIIFYERLDHPALVILVVEIRAAELVELERFRWRCIQQHQLDFQLVSSLFSLGLGNLWIFKHHFLYLLSLRTLLLLEA